MSSSISNSENPRRFIIRFCLFCLPLLAMLLPLELFLWRTGESRSARAVLEMQANADDEILYGRGLLNQQFNVYKVAGWNRHKPRIVAAGSSRVWRLRSFAFHPLEDGFYNAGGILQCADDVRELAEMIDDGRLSKPEAIIIGFDPWWYKANHPDYTWLDKPSLRDDAFRLAARRNVIKRIWQDPSLLKQSPSDGNVGIFGSIGFRLDGTMKVSTNVVEEFRSNPVYVDRESPPIIERIQNLSGRFRESATSSQALDKTVTAVKLLRSQNIRVIAYFPPFADDSWDAVVQSESIMQWMNYYIDNVVPALSAESSEVIDLCHSQEFGLDDTYFLDGMHPGEVFSALQWIRLVEREQQQSFYRQFAPSYVRQQIKERCSTPLAFD